MTVTIHEAKTHLSRLIAAVEKGEEVIIARRDQPVARLVPERSRKPKIKLGFGLREGDPPVNLEGFDDPKLNEEIAQDFEDAVARDKGLG